ncbi:hypothetical protein HHL17_18560 [Chitinophaga sp. G-6-1-13]|uniref:Uncharacterized protein n=1 Tax=Chitinophaga fulva TaxID=2728842 RepID=A0A848GPB5_9BACT|nr:hypothetical protein [Chitinophaga fulva]NML39209.1 hypothetical protein [Chitinophaga fulva]
MIDEADIRIGNYVAYFDYNMEESVFAVEGILDGYIYNSGLPKSKISCEKANPVLLDLYQLIKFDFIRGVPEEGEDENIYSLKYNRLNSLHIRYENGCFQPVTESANGFVPYGRPLVHVHQLQNLFHALSRDELTL